MSLKVTALMLVFVLFFTACGTVSSDESIETTTVINTENIGQKPSQLSFRGVWISYIEIMKNSSDGDAFRSYLQEMFLNFEKVGITDVFFHVRPFGDALYYSELFPSSHTVCENQGDTLKADYLRIALDTAEKYGMKLHAWINPYRVSDRSDITFLSEKNQARIWYEEGGNDVFLVGDRYYFNPASERVKNLIADGVRELLEKYDDLAGIHIDDYFYPDKIEGEDKEQHEDYQNSGGSEDLSAWRQENVNTLVRALYSAVKSYGEDKLFTVSPNGKTDTCKYELYADVELWCKEKGYCDIILPQIYFGFENESQPFSECLEKWTELCEGSDVKLVPALSLYKSGQADAYAGSGENEWCENGDIIKRQVMLIKELELYGFGLYSGSYVNFSESFCRKELDNLISVL